MQQSPMNKVVLATALEYNGLSKSPIDYFKTIYQYTKTPSIIAFFIQYDLWMGATPERLISMQQSHLTTMALAGTSIFGQQFMGSKKGRARVCCE